MTTPDDMRSVYREMKARDPDQILVFRGSRPLWHRFVMLLDDDAREVRGRFGDSFVILSRFDSDGERITLAGECLERLLAAIVAAGRRAAVLEPAGSEGAKGEPVERIVTKGDFDE